MLCNGVLPWAVWLGLYVSVNIEATVVNYCGEMAMAKQDLYAVFEANTSRSARSFNTATIGRLLELRTAMVILSTACRIELPAAGS